MSSDVNCIRSTICRDLTDTSPSVSNCNQLWDRLPLEMAVHIYRFLPMNDKLNMSLTCKFWLAAFRQLGTWRYSHFVFTGNSSVTREIPVEVLSSLQYVTIDCSVPSDTQPMKKIDTLVNFLVGLNESKNTTLQKLNILDMKDIGFPETICGLHHQLRALLVKQTKLSSMCLFNGGLSSAHGLELFAAAGANSAHCLKYLNVHKYSKLTVPLEPELTFAQHIGTFTNLTELSINCNFVSDDLLNHLSGTLKLIIVWVHWFDLGWFDMDPTYSGDGWNMLVSKCTGLKAEYHVEDLEGHMEIGPTLVLLPEVPLATFHWRSRGGPRKIMRLCFDELINTFKNCLEHLHVDVGCNILSKRDALAVVDRCPLLQTFSISPKSAPQKLICQVENILAQRQHNKRS